MFDVLLTAKLALLASFGPFFPIVLLFGVVIIFALGLSVLSRRS